MANIHAQLGVLSARERASLKGREIAKTELKGEYERGALRIQIVRMRPIDGGVEIFARAWKDGRQIGFGTDGDIDIERFLIYNPPVLVQDEMNGDIVQTWTDRFGVEYTRKLREDTREAILQTLEHTIVVKKQRSTTNKIKRGKVGNTTSTFFSTSGSDAIVYRYQSAEAWATIRSGSGTGIDATRVTFQAGANSSSSGGSTWRVISRSIIGFDTSALADTDTINSATLSLYGQGLTDNASWNHPTLYVDRRVPGNESSLAASDYDIGGWDGVAQSDTTYAFDAVSLAAYNDFALNATGIGNVNKTGNSWFGIRSTGDRDNSEFSPYVADKEEFIDFYSADQTGTTNDPKLVVEHTAGSTAHTATATGTARIQKSVTQTNTGTARVTATTSATETGIARLQNSANQTISGTARIGLVTSMTIAGLSRVTAATARTITGIARMTASAARTITGTARITASTLRTITGKSRVSVTRNTSVTMSSGPQSPTSIPSTQWTNPTNAYANDGAYTTVVSSSSLGYRQRYNTFGLSIPSTATILGILVEVKGYVSAADNYLHVYLQKGGVYAVPQGLDDTYRSFGSSSYLWGQVWTPDDFSDANFEVSIESHQVDGVTYYVDHVRATVYYTTALTGKARVTAAIARTITGKSRITAAATKTTTGKGRVTASTTRTATGVANIFTTVTTTKTETGVSRITATAIQTIAGLARVTVGTLRTLTGASRIEKAVSQAIGGTSRVTASASQTETGTARVTATATQTTTGAGRIQQVVQAPEHGIARVEKVSTSTETGLASILVTSSTTQTEDGTARITATTSKTENGLSRIERTVADALSGVARVSRSTLATVSAIARVQVATAHTIAGVARVEITTLYTSLGKARIQQIVGAAIEGVSRITNTTSQVQTGAARLTATLSATVTGVSMLQRTETQSTAGMSRIERIETAAIGGTARITRPMHSGRPALVLRTSADHSVLATKARRTVVNLTTAPKDSIVLK